MASTPGSPDTGSTLIQASLCGTFDHDGDKSRFDDRLMHTLDGAGAPFLGGAGTYGILEKQYPPFVDAKDDRKDVSVGNFDSIVPFRGTLPAVRKGFPTMTVDLQAVVRVPSEAIAQVRQAIEPILALRCTGGQDQPSIDEHRSGNIKESRRDDHGRGQSEGIQFSSDGRIIDGADPFVLPRETVLQIGVGGFGGEGVVQAQLVAVGTSKRPEEKREEQRGCDEERRSATKTDSLAER